MSEKCKSIISGVCVACACLVVFGSLVIGLPSAAICQDSQPRCKVVMGLANQNGTSQFEQDIAEMIKEGYKVVGFSSIKHEERGFYIQALMVKEGAAPVAVQDKPAKAAEPAKEKAAAKKKSN
ncbi:MAG: hypothetical protein V1793_06740 [Pseudomonadota bacterium]